MRQKDPFTVPDTAFLLSLVLYLVFAGRAFRNYDEFERGDDRFNSILARLMKKPDFYGIPYDQLFIRFHDLFDDDFINDIRMLTHKDAEPLLQTLETLMCVVLELAPTSVYDRESLLNHLLGSIPECSLFQRALRIVFHAYADKTLSVEILQEGRSLSPVRA